jgi:uncharacterized protein YndB with AHSA1/START domain
VTRISRHIRAPRERVYRTLLDPAGGQQWMVPDDMTSETDTFHGRFVRLVPNKEVVQSVEFETTDPGMQGEMTITYTLADAGGGTDLVGRHEDLPAGVAPAAGATGSRTRGACRMKLSTRTTARQNLVVASINTALERGLITLECEPFKPATFEFNLGPYPVVAHINDAGFDEVNVKAIVCPTELGRRTLRCAVLHG